MVWHLARLAIFPHDPFNSHWACALLPCRVLSFYRSRASLKHTKFIGEFNTILCDIIKNELKVDWEIKWKTLSILENVPAPPKSHVCLIIGVLLYCSASLIHARFLGIPPPAGFLWIKHYRDLEIQCCSFIVSVLLDQILEWSTQHHFGSVSTRRTAAVQECGSTA